MKAMPPMSRKVRFAYFIFFAVVFVVAIPVVSLYASGYRLGENFSLVKMGGVYVHTSQNGARLSLNTKVERVLSTFDRGFFIQNLKPGNYFITVSKEGFISWEKDIRVKEGLVTEISAFLLPRTIKLEALFEVGSATSTRSAEFRKIGELFASPDRTELSVATTSAKALSPLLTKDRPLVRFKTAVWKENGAVYASWKDSSSELPHFFCVALECKETIRVFESADPIGQVDFYPGRQDTLLIGVPQGIVAVGIDQTSPRYALPFYTRHDIDFRVQDNERVFIKEDGVIYEAII